MFTVSLNDQEVKTISTLYNVNGALGAGIILTKFTDFIPQALENTYSKYSGFFIAASMIGSMFYVLAKNHLVPIEDVEEEEADEDEDIGVFEGA